jgi:hypothetical protein
VGDDVSAEWNDWRCINQTVEISGRMRTIRTYRRKRGTNLIQQMLLRLLTA